MVPFCGADGFLTITKQVKIDGTLFARKTDLTVETVTLDNASPPFFVGVDVGGTSIKIGIVDDDGRTIGYSSFPTNDESGIPAAIQRMKETIDALVKSSTISYESVAAIGLGTPGTMDIPNGMILEPPNIPGWRNFPIRDELAQVTRKPVTFANDAGAAAFGEFWVGSGKKHNSIVMLTLGTGVGGGIIIDGKSIDGENSHGSECGHVTIDSSPTARVCSCGIRGHLEAYASATAIVKRCEEALLAGETSSLANVLARGEKITGLTIAKAADSGDELANQLVLETADYLAQGMAIFMHTIDPSAMIIGGAMNFGGSSKPLGQKFLKRIHETVSKIALPICAKNIDIEFATLSGDAGYIGAAGMAREEFYKK